MSWFKDVADILGQCKQMHASGSRIFKLSLCIQQGGTCCDDIVDDNYVLSYDSRVMVGTGVRVRQGFEGGGGLAENVACLE